MTPDRKVELKNIMNEYRGKTLCYGEHDCNLLVLEMFFPEQFKALKGRYKTKVGGARVAKKEFGYPSLKEYLKDVTEEIKGSHKLPFDILVFDGVDVAICTQGGAFGICPDKSFGFFRLDSTNYKVYRGK